MTATPFGSGSGAGPGADTACPCGAGSSFATCCRPLHRQDRLASTAEELMRSRYSAYVTRDDDHVFRTWHPRTRPEDVSTSPALRWEGLEVVRSQDGGDRFWCVPTGQSRRHDPLQKRSLLSGTVE